MMNTQPASSRRRLWLWLAAAAAAAVVVVVAGVVGLGMIYGPRDVPAPQPGTTTRAPSTPSTPATSAPPAAAGVDGCLGGDSRSPQAVLDAQAAAPHTPEGAVSFAITFARWGTQKPVVPDDEIAQLDGVVITSENFAESVKTLNQLGQPQLYVTSLNGYYRINTFDSDRVELTLMLPLVIGGAIDPTLNFMPSYVVEWTDRGWVITGAPEVDDANTLRSTGVAIPGGC